MSEIKFPCPECKVAIRITKPELAGKKIRCPKCKAVCLVPAASTPAASPARPPKPPQEVKMATPIEKAPPAVAPRDELPPLEFEKAPPRPAVVRKEQPPLQPDIAEDDWGDFEDRPARKKKGEDRITKAKDRDDASEADTKGKEKKPRKRSKVWPILALIVVLAYAGWVAATLMGYVDVMELIGGKSSPTGQQGKAPSNHDPAGLNGEQQGPEMIDLPARDPAAEARLASERQRRLEASRKTEEGMLEDMKNSEAARQAMRGELIRINVGNMFDHIAFSPDSQFVAAGVFDSTVRVWNLRTGKLEHTLPGHMNGVGDVQFSPDNKTLATRDLLGNIRLWDRKSGSILRMLPGPPFGGRELSLSPDGSRVACFGRPSPHPKAEVKWSLGIYDVNTGALVDSNPEDPRSVADAEFHPGGKMLAATTEDGLELLEIGTGKHYRHQLKMGGVARLGFSPDGWKLAVAGGGINDPNGSLLDLETGEELPHPNELKSSTQLAFTPDGKKLYFTSDSVLYSMPLDGPAPSATRVLDGVRRLNFAISPGGVFLAVASDRDLVIWSLANLDQSANRKEPSPEATVAASVKTPDGFFDANLNGKSTHRGVHR